MSKKSKKPRATTPEWLFDGKPVDPVIFEGMAGFIYKITDLSTGIAYIGKKTLVTNRVRTYKTGRKRRRITKESDWRSYWSSSKELHDLVNRRGPELFRREVLIVCATKRDLSYCEVKVQFELNVLEDERYLNFNVLGRFFKLPPDVVSSRICAGGQPSL